MKCTTVSKGAQRAEKTPSSSKRLHNPGCHATQLGGRGRMWHWQLFSRNIWDTGHTCRASFNAVFVVWFNGIFAPSLRKFRGIGVPLRLAVNFGGSAMCIIFVSHNESYHAFSRIYIHIQAISWRRKTCLLHVLWIWIILKQHPHIEFAKRHYLRYWFCSFMSFFCKHTVVSRRNREIKYKWNDVWR